MPITRPVDLLWPPVIIEPSDYFSGYATYPVGGPSPDPAPVSERGVDIRLDDCMENAGMAGYNFASRQVVSCEDSTVDIYLSINDSGSYYFLVPEDTQIKDLGPRYDMRSIRLIKPGNWSDNHGTPLSAGHVYVVWTPGGDLYLVKVDALWGKHVLFSWLWHSRLSREQAERFLKNNAAGPPPSPYFTR